MIIVGFDRARDVFRPAGAKDDEGDALVAADLLRGNLTRYKPLHPQSDDTLELRSLARLHLRLTEDKTVLLQRLRTRLAEWSPALSALCTDLNRSWQRALLCRWPLHEDLHKAHANSIRAFCTEHRICSATRKRITATLDTQPLFIPAGRRKALRLETAAILEQLDALIDTLQALHRDLEEAFGAHPNYRVFNSLPVKGVSSLAMACRGLRRPQARANGLARTGGPLGRRAGDGGIRA